MNKCKKILLLLLACFAFTFSYAQNINWILGTWQGTGTDDNKVEFIKTIIIDSIAGNNFSGTRTNESKNHSRIKIITSFSGYIDNDQIYIKNGTVLYKKIPSNGEWLDCSACLPETKITIAQNKVILTSRIIGCQKECNSVTVYYKALCDYDTSTQRYLVNHFGTSSDNKNFQPCIQKSPEQIAEEKKRQQEIDDSIRNAASVARQKEQQRIQDSIGGAVAIAKKRQKEIEDSITLVKKRQQQINDSLKVVAALEKKRQQQIQDSITVATNIAKQKEQQRIQDSVAAAAAIAKKRQKEIDDSIALVKKRQQQINDSLKVVAAIEKKRQKRIEDSVANAVNIAKQKEQQRIQDSITNATNIAKKRQQQIDDSVKNAAVIAKKKPPVITDTAKASTTKAFETRDNVLLETYHITTPDILIELFDNAQIDGDRVSVYHNNTLIVNNKTLLREPITIKIHADTTNRLHEFIMIAENLGTIPPNTALMRITAGNQVYKLSVKTDMKTNAKIVFYYDGN